MPYLLAARYLSKLMLQIFVPSNYHDLETTNPRILPLGRSELTTLLAHLGAPKKNRDGAVFHLSSALTPANKSFSRSREVRCEAGMPVDRGDQQAC